MQTFISNYGYLAIFVLMLAESACLPVPSELIMTFGGALAAGAVPGTHLNLVGVIAAGIVGNVAGSYIAWAVGRYGAEPALRRWGKQIGIREHDIDRGITWFERHGNKTVLIGRMLPVVRTFISLPAGIAEMPALRFGIYTTIGCIPWTTALAVAGVRGGPELGVHRQRLPRPDLHHRGRGGGRTGRRGLALPPSPNRRRRRGR